MDHYRTLQVRRDAEPEVIEKAYRALSLKYHPDTADPAVRAQATRRMQELNAAYTVLRDPASRARYDETLPPEAEGAGGWERFWDAGLVGLFFDWVERQQ
jgi:DnaJ-class molecular chaperone